VFADTAHISKVQHKSFYSVEGAEGNGGTGNKNMCLRLFRFFM
jgi:hypothetical protein